MNKFKYVIKLTFSSMYIAQPLIFDKTQSYLNKLN